MSAGPLPIQPCAGRRLLVVFGSYRSKRHLFERAHELGVRLVVVDGPGHWAEADQGEDGLIERFLAVDLAPFETFAERAAAAAHDAGLDFDGLGAIDEFAGGFAARLALLMRLPFHSVEAADLARDKHGTREACERAGLPGPRFARLASDRDIEAAARYVGFPAVLKPLSGVGSVQAYKVEDESALRRRFTSVRDEIAGAQEPPLEGLRSDRDWFRVMWGRGAHLILESWIEGPKYDVDLLLDEGRVVYAHATDDLQPCGLRDVRRLAPSDLSRAAERELIDHAAACVRAIGFRRGAFNVEVKRTNEGPRMIEVNGRLGGYSTTDIHEEVWGVNLLEQWLRSCFGLPLEVVEREPTGFVAESLLPSPRTGTVERDGFLEKVRFAPGVLAARPWVFEGDEVAGVETGAPDWLGAVLARGPTREAALAQLDRHVSSLDLPVISRVGKT